MTRRPRHSKKKKKARKAKKQRTPVDPGRLSSVFAFDLRGLAAMRIGLGILVVLDVLNRALSFTAHYTDAGVLPRAAYFAEFETDWHISLHLLTSSQPLLALLFVLAAIFGVMLALGYKTRVATIASWMLMISLHSRNTWVLQGGDEIFRALLFWGMFLPLGARYSLDRALAADHDSPPRQPVVSMATVCLLGQVVFLYAFATASKAVHPVWWKDGLGVYFALNVEQFTTRVGLWLRDLTGLLVVLNYATLVAQAATPVLLLTPIARNALRTIVAIAMIGLHLGFAITMQLGLFSYIVVAMWLAFLPPGLWDRVERRIPDLGPWWRERLGGRVKSRPAPPVELVRSPITRALLATALVYVLWWNLANASRDFLRMPKSLTVVADVLRLDQRFHMFSNPPRWTQWYIVVGIAEGGEKIDVITGEPPSYDKPDLVSATFESQRWRKYINNLARPAGKPHRKHFASYMCRRWNDDHGADEQITRVDIVMMRQATPPKPRRQRRPADRAVLGEWACP